MESITDLDYSDLYDQAKGNVDELQEFLTNAPAPEDEQGSKLRDALQRLLDTYNGQVIVLGELVDLLATPEVEEGSDD